MSTTITIKRNDKDNFKTIVLVCLDKMSGKYRSLNLAARTIAPQLYDSPEDFIATLEKLKVAGRICDYELIKTRE